MDNVFGDLSTTGVQQREPRHRELRPRGRRAGDDPASARSRLPTPLNATIQIGTGATTEVVVISTTAASSVVNFVNNPLRFTHPTGPTVSTCGTPFTHRFAALNSQLGYGGAYGAQPPTHTFTDVTNIVNVFTSASYGTAPSNAYGARQYASACLKSMDFSGNAEQNLGIKMAGDTWLSTGASSAVTNVTTNSRPDPELELHRRHRRQHRLLLRRLRDHRGIFRFV